MKPRLKYSDLKKKPTFAELIERYMHEMNLPGARQIGGSAQYIMRALRRSTLGPIVAADMKASDFINHCRLRKASGVCAATINQDMTEAAHDSRHTQGRQASGSRPANARLHRHEDEAMPLGYAFHDF